MPDRLDKQDWLQEPVFLTGATGFVGTHLYPKLVDLGLEVRCGTRNPDKARERDPSCQWVEFDVERPATLAPALEGCGSAFYLIHQMQQGEGYREREERSARAFLDACEEAGVRRLVYLGGVEPEGLPSEHLASRLHTGRILRGGHHPGDHQRGDQLSTVELRASMIVGAGSASWQIVRDLAARLPFMVLPQWTQSHTQPVYIDDVVEALAGALDLELDGSAWFDIPGPQTLSVENILKKTARSLGHEITAFPVPLLSPRLSSFWLKFVTRGDIYMARELVEGLKSDLLAEDDAYWEMIGHTDLVSFDEAARRASQETAPDSRLSRVYEGLVRTISRPSPKNPLPGG
jgi:uncharacterized protein YbjT (DUF2867 family)